NLIAPHAAMTLACLDDVDRQIENNKKRFYTYRELLKDVKGIELVEYATHERRSFKNILVKLTAEWPYTREETLLILQKENMVVRPYYYPPLHLKETVYPVIVGDMTNTSLLMTNHMLLPCGEFVSENDIKTIVEYFKFLETNHVTVKNSLKTNLN
ncbi:MAG TPA: DegT/DnrJ/EryC1/StrS family aminotransferase, partial [Flavobacteriales bacterium]|nr:DegT/DnrJ/EryC1/StrS family aminotransferase [Flavobacteriales bacterium]